MARCEFKTRPPIIWTSARSPLVYPCNIQSLLWIMVQLACLLLSFSSGINSTGWISHKVICRIKVLRSSDAIRLNSSLRPHAWFWNYRGRFIKVIFCHEKIADSLWYNAIYPRYCQPTVYGVIPAYVHVYDPYTTRVGIFIGIQLPSNTRHGI